MVQPIDYFGGMQTPGIADSLLSGVQIGSGLRQMRDARADQERERSQREAYARDLQETLNNPSPQAFAAMATKYPQQRQAYKQAWDMLNDAQKGADFSAGVEVYNAISTGRPDIAKSILGERIVAMRNSGQDPRSFEAIVDSIDGNPSAAASAIGLSLAAIDPDKWSKVIQAKSAAEQAPAELSEKQAKAAKAATEAKFAESSEALRLQKLGWDITKVQEDIGIARENSRISALNANIAREKNDLKRDEMRLKLNEALEKRDTALREKVASVETGRASIDNMLTTADRILKTPVGVVDSAAGPVSTRLPTVSSDTADFEELVNTMASQAFMAQIPGLKGMGALSNAEGEKLQSSLQNLSLRQSPKRLLENVREAQRLMLKARGSLADRYGVPDVVPDRPEAQTEREAATAEIPVADTSGFRVIGVER